MSQKEIEEFTQKLDEIIKAIIYLILEIPIEKVQKEPEHFFYSIIFKTVHTLEAVNLLSYNVLQKPFFLISCGLSMRTVISDLIIAEYLIFKSENSGNPDSELLKQIERQYFDHYQFTKRNINIYETLYGDKKEFLKVKKEFNEYEKKFLDSDGNIKSYLKKGDSIFRMIKFLASKYDKSNMQRLKIAFECYDIFSKIEHFGEKTMELISQSATQQRSKFSFETLLYSIKISLNILEILLLVFFDKKSAKLKKLSSQIEEFNKLEIPNTNSA
ncbi:MAG: hypothetical protein R2825_23235 [Saprospiraceae bacterium]